MKFTQVAAILAASQILSGCLTTRAGMKEQEEKQVIRKQVQTLQQSNADVNNRFNDIEDSVRRLQGRVEVVETNQKTSAGNITKNEQALDNKINENNAAYREEFAKLQGEIESLKAQLAAMNEERGRAAQAAADAKAKADKEADADPFQLGENKYDQKNWREAILDFERYRKNNPKGKKFASATLKIGDSFKELGMADEARAFYEEVISKFPKSKEAGQADKKLKSLKKK